MMIAVARASNQPSHTGPAVKPAVTVEYAATVFKTSVADLIVAKPQKWKDNIPNQSHTCTA
jgi:hypothetical protein